MKIKVHSHARLADLFTPVGLFMRIRERYSEALLLESSDYSSRENSLSFLCFDSLATLAVSDGKLNHNDSSEFDITAEMTQFLNRFDIEDAADSARYNGVFGFSSFDAVQHFEKISFDNPSITNDIPELRYDLFRYIVVFDHYYNKMLLFENCPSDQPSGLADIVDFLSRQDNQSFDFKPVGDESTPITDEEYIAMVTKAKEHCQRGDVFQLVLSRRFQQQFKGDEFNVYRCLRSINPSPYLFYFDYGSYKIFGSSPEAQLKVEDNVAEIHPIAGTFRRTNDVDRDLELAEELKRDPKENAEHVMLVDLARNDLSRNCSDVSVTSYKEVQFFSHVIHLTSVVKGKVDEGVSAFQIFADTFPAGTLSGAPKYKAMQLIDEYETHQRGFYGGGIGVIQFNGNLNHAIVIRSFLSQNNTLSYQAGAGLVIDSNESKELQEVNNKLAALKKALLNATNI